MRSRFLFPVALLFSLAPGASLAQKGRDLSKLDACKVLTPSDVTAAAKRKLVKSGGGEVHCMYLVEAPNSGADTYDFYLNAAAAVEAGLSVMTAKEKGTPVPGLWTEAYIGPSAGSPNQLSLVVVKGGDMAFEIQGPSKDVLISLAKTAVGRLK